MFQTRRMVLLVEDEFLILASVREALEAEGFDVKTCRSGRSAMETLDARGADAFGALVTDIQLGEGPDGWAVARRAREISPALPVVYMTGAGHGEWGDRAVPGSVLVGKPLAPEVAETVARLLAAGGGLSRA